MAIPAKFPGTCPVCEKAIDQGMLITQHPSLSRWVHEWCKNGENVQESNEETVEVSEKISVALSDESPDEINSPELKDKLQNLEAMMQQLDAQLDGFVEKEIKPHDEAIEKATQKESEIYEEMVAKMQEWRDQRAAEERAKREAEATLKSLQGNLQDLQKQYDETLGMLAAQERLNKLAEKVRDVFEDKPWGEAVLDFQKEDILFTVRAFEEDNSGVLNANVMGAGKTLETVASLDVCEQLFYKRENRKPRIIWLTKKSLIRSTFREILSWSNRDDNGVPERPMLILEGTKQQRSLQLDMALQMNAMVITNYEQLWATERILEIEWDFIVMDEVHKLKGGASSNPTKIFECSRKLVGLEHKGSSYYGGDIFERTRDVFFLPLSGSPIQNKPEEMWTYFHLFRPDKFPSVRKFQREYCTQEWDEEKQQHVYHANNEKLIQALKGQVIRQDPERVQKAWPDKHRAFYYVQLNEEQRKVYDQIKDGFFVELQNKADADDSAKMPISAIIAMLTRLRQAAVYPGGIKYHDPIHDAEYEVDCDDSAKLDLAMEKIEDLVLQEQEQVVVWSAQFNAPLHALEERIKGLGEGISCALMTGETDNKNTIEKLFQEGEIDVLLCNRAAVGEGFNFQKNPTKWEGGARHAIFLDLWWNPAANEQAEDRIWRQGAEEGVTIHIVLAEDSVDSFMTAILEEKEEMIKGVVGDKKKSSFRPSEWLEILDEMV